MEDQNTVIAILVKLGFKYFLSNYIYCVFIKVSWHQKLQSLLSRIRGNKIEITEEKSDNEEKIMSFQDLITSTIVNWARSNKIQDSELIRTMFLLMYRQYNAVGEVSFGH